MFFREGNALKYVNVQECFRADVMEGLHYYYAGKLRLNRNFLPHSSVAKPRVGNMRTYIWGHKVRDDE